MGIPRMQGSSLVIPCEHHIWYGVREEVYIKGACCVVRKCVLCQCYEVVWSKKTKLEGVILGPDYKI